MVENDNLTNTLVNDKFLNWLYNNTTQFQLRLNNEFWPPEPIQALNDPQAYLQYLRFVNKWALGGKYQNPVTISFEDFMNNRFVIVTDLQTYPNEGLFNNISTNTSGNNVFLRIYMTAAPPVPTSLITYAVVGRTIDFSGSRLRQ